MTEVPEIFIELLGLEIELVKIDGLANVGYLEGSKTQAPSIDIENDPQEDLSLGDYFQRFVLEHQEQMNETELAQKLGISRKCLWERRQRFTIPRRKKSS